MKAWVVEVTTILPQAVDKLIYYEIIPYGINKHEKLAESEICNKNH